MTKKAYLSQPLTLDHRISYHIERNTVEDDIIVNLLKIVDEGFETRSV